MSSFGSIKKGAFTAKVGKPTVSKENKILAAKDGAKLKFGKKSVAVNTKDKREAVFAKNAQEHKFGHARRGELNIKEHEAPARHSDSVLKEK